MVLVGLVGIKGRTISFTHFSEGFTPSNPVTRGVITFLRYLGTRTMWAWRW